MNPKTNSFQKLINDIKGLKRLWPFLRENKRYLIIAACLIPLISAAQSTMPLLIKWTIDNGIVAKNESNIWLGAGLGLGLIVFEYFTRAGQTMYTALAVHRMIRNMRSYLVRHIMRLSASFHDRNLSGALVTRATSDFDNLSESLNQGVLNSIVDAAVLLGALIGLFILNWQLALCALLIMPVVIVVVTQASRLLKRTMLSARSKIAALNGFTQECLYGSTTIKLLAAEKHAQKKFDGLVIAYRNAQMKSVVIDASLFAVLDGISSITIGIILWFAVSQIYGQDSGLSVGVMVAFVQYIQTLFEPLKQLGNKIAMLQGAFTSLDRIFKIIDTNDFVEGDELPKEIEGSIQAKNVSFRYDLESSKPILDAVSFELKAGESLALVGRTGSGKSTIIKLLSKLYGDFDGSIHLDGQDLRDLDGHELRKKIAMVPQDIVLFDGSILFNITLGHPNISREDAINASKLVGLHPIIEQLENDYDYKISEEGVNLSQGQRQLIVFARALAKDPKLIILDEATSSVDPASERLIQSAIDRILHDRTVIVIAHRLSTIRSCDQIILLRQGKIQEKGNHESLMESGGQYFQLYQALEG
ncbi:ABC transporter ATP-binding protein [Pseudobacteriovorax antillogorgiicola]|uniref:Multidrug resistance-like ATP-binding protein MdlB n=1 Tax=Pseudobacteriovorax antillogorgiicola TaxID=1513793 RepID=A0A1Y6BUV8_9BACT|nr:ABC transporter ATP-binding protein [Pseudobacteriovorax antillogorgiicola]TCS53865.1 ATP-binding cassette subfamily B protein [Pseudobacteriovorax antillogorgiicola]SMF21397.1 ATP-binding cassette, subfamily B [Pseudobacteriovorax antillogorgiicola]